MSGSTLEPPPANGSASGRRSLACRRTAVSHQLAAASCAVVVSVAADAHRTAAPPVKPAQVRCPSHSPGRQGFSGYWHCRCRWSAVESGAVDQPDAQLAQAWARMAGEAGHAAAMRRRPAGPVQAAYMLATTAGNTCAVQMLRWSLPRRICCLVVCSARRWPGCALVHARAPGGCGMERLKASRQRP